MASSHIDERFVAFIDIVGFKSAVTAAESGVGMSLRELLRLPKMLGDSEDVGFFEEHGPRICPDSSRLHQNLDFKITQVSDCAVISCEISPAGVSNIVGHCWSADMRLLMRGFMVRGYVTMGTFVHDNEMLGGSAYNRAVDREGTVAAFRRDTTEIGTPFIEIDPTVEVYVRNCDDPCAVEMFERHVKSDGVVSAIFHSSA